MEKTDKKQKLFLWTIPFIFFFFWICVSIISCKKDYKQPEKFAGEQQIQIAEPNSQQIKWLHPRSNERMNERKQMVSVIENRYDFKDKKVLDAMLNVPRHWFVPDSIQSYAYSDSPLPIGHGQTISQPFIVAYMTSLLELTENKKVLEIGTGSGYQAAVLTELTPYVYTIEIVEPLGRSAEKTLLEKGYNTVKVKIADGYKGWPQFAPFDAIIVTCAPDHIPPDLLEQLRPGGKLIIPVTLDDQMQDLILVSKERNGKITRQSTIPVRFVPMLRDKNR